MRTPTAAVTIRPLASPADYAACVALQEATWGAGHADLTPTILRVCQEVGSVALGAFDRTGRLRGFVFGFTGVRHGHLAHWSHMLAVRAQSRNHGIGRRLKLAQARAVRRLGVASIYWTFDPLIARNAHLNLNRLGVEVEDYVTDMYAAENSPVDRVIGSDRLVVRWALGRGSPRHSGGGRPRGRSAAAPDPRAPNAPVVRAVHDPLPSTRTVRIAIPGDIHALRDRDPATARAWRMGSRRAFLHYLDRGYRVRRFDVSPSDGGCYLLTAPHRGARRSGR